MKAIVIGAFSLTVAIGGYLFVTASPPSAMAASTHSTAPQAAEGAHRATPIASVASWAPPRPVTLPYEEGRQDEPVIIYEVQGPSSQQLRLRILRSGDINFVLGEAKSQYMNSTPEVYHNLALAKAAGFFSLRGTYGKAGVPGDTYDVVTINRDGQTKTVRVAEAGGKGATPPALLELIASLRRLAVERWNSAHHPRNQLPFPFPTFPHTADTGRSSGSKAYTVSFEVAGMGTSPSMQIEPDGRVSLYVGHYGQSVGSSAYITPALLSQLTSQIEAARFFELNEENIRLPVPTPTDAERGMPVGHPTDHAYLTIIVTKGVRSNSIKTVYFGGFTPEVKALLLTLSEILSARETGGTPLAEKEMLIRSFVSDCAGNHWQTFVDVEGNVYLESAIYVGQLSESELRELRELFTQNGWFGLADVYRVPSSDTRKDIRCGADVTFTWEGSTKQVEAEVGADVPGVLDAILAKLAGIYTRFQQASNAETWAADNLPTGMPKAGNPLAHGHGWLSVLSLIGTGGVMLGLTLRCRHSAAECKQLPGEAGSRRH